MGGSGSEMSSIATVTFMPGRSIAWRGFAALRVVDGPADGALDVREPSIGGFG